MPARRVRYRQVASDLVRLAFGPLPDSLTSEAGAELSVLVQELLDPDEADWFCSDHRSEQRLRNLLASVKDVLDDYDSRRLVCPLDRTTTNTFFRFTLREEDHRQLQSRLRLHAELLGYLRAMDPGGFERLCGRLLEHIGCRVFVTRSSVDSGADFIGRLPVAPGGLLDRTAKHRLLGGLSLLLLGQAKRYADYNKINEETIKQIEGTWGNIQRRRMDGNLPAHLNNGLNQIGWKAGDAFSWLFVTTGSYTRPARDWAVSAQMATLDGDQLTQLLLHDALGIEQVDELTWTTSADVLNAWCA